MKMTNITIRLPNQTIKDRFKAQAKYNFCNDTAYAKKILFKYITSDPKPKIDWYVEKIPATNPTIGVRVKQTFYKELEIAAKKNGLSSMNSFIDHTGE